MENSEERRYKRAIAAMEIVSRRIGDLGFGFSLGFLRIAIVVSEQ